MDQTACVGQVRQPTGGNDRNDSRPQRHPVIDEDDVGAPALCESAAICEPRRARRNLVSELGLAAIVVTHDLAVARLLSHRVMVMKGGRVIETGLTDQVLDDPCEPYTQLLVSSILPA
jgi:Fe-S cluster assembly ATPase SufC